MNTPDRIKEDVNAAIEIAGNLKNVIKKSLLKDVKKLGVRNSEQNIQAMEGDINRFANDIVTRIVCLPR